MASKSGSDDFLVSYVNATVFLGCHLADPEIIWLLDGEDVEEYIDYRVKEEVALSPADFDVSGVLLGDEGSNRKPRVPTLPWRTGRGVTLVFPRWKGPVMTWGRGLR